MTTRFQNLWIDIAAMESDGSGGYTRREERGHSTLTTSCSDAGMQQMFDSALIMERARPALEALEPLLGLCPDHGLTMVDEDGEPFQWSINDYWMPIDTNHLQLIFLTGWHRGGRFCVAAEVMATAKGDLILCEVPQPWY